MEEQKRPEEEPDFHDRLSSGLGTATHSLSNFAGAFQKCFCVKIDMEAGAGYGC